MFYLTKQEKVVVLTLAAVIFWGALFNVFFKLRPEFLSWLNEEEKFVYKTNVNTASFQELIEVPYIGEKTARRLIEYRTSKGRIGSLEEIKNLPGIYLSSFEQMKKYLDI